MTTEHKPEEIEALADFCELEGQKLMMLGSRNQNKYYDAMDALRAYAALLRVRETDKIDGERYRWLRDTADRDDYGHPYIAVDEWYYTEEDDDAEISVHWLQGAKAEAAIDAARLALAQMEPKP